MRKIIKTIGAMILASVFLVGIVQAARVAPNFYDRDNTTIYLDKVTWNLSIGTSSAETKLNVAGTTTAQDLIPYNDSMYSLGTTALRWENVWADSITVGGTTTLTNLVITGTLYISGTIGGGDLNFDGHALTNASFVEGDYLVATSSSATSTFEGAVVVSTDVFVIDTYDGLIGIGTSTPDAKLTVVGNISGTGTLDIDGISTLAILKTPIGLIDNLITTSTSISSILNVTGNSVLATTSMTEGMTSNMIVTNELSAAATTTLATTSMTQGSADEFCLTADTCRTTWPAGASTAWDDIGNPDAADEIDFGVYDIELNVESFHIGDGGSNYWRFTSTTLMNAGTAVLNLLAATDLLIAGSQINFDDMAGDIDAGKYAAASIDGDDINSNLAGTGLTLTSATPDTLDLDIEYRTFTKCFVIEQATSTDKAFAQILFPTASTLTYVSCSTTANGTTTIQADERAEITPNTSGTDVLTSPIVCDSNSATTTSFSNASMATRSLLSFDIDSSLGTPTTTRFCIEYTVND